MASKARVAAVLAGVGLLGIAVGPVPHVEPIDATRVAAAIPKDPAAVAAWVAESEAKHPDVTPGAEATIVWGAAEGQKTPLALVYLHGFSATRQEIAPVTEDVARELGANVYFARLTGHGVPGAQLGEATAADWVEDTVEAVEIGKRLGDRVVLIGTSTGATLAVDREARAHDPAVIGLIAISPNFGPKDANAELLLYPWVTPLLGRALGDRVWEPKNEQMGRYWTTRYPTTAVGPMMAVVQSAREAPLDRISAPTLFVWAEQDQVVEANRTAKAFERLPEGLRDRQEVDCGPPDECHVLAGDIVAPSRNAQLEAWMTERIRRWAAN